MSGWAWLSTSLEKFQCLLKLNCRDSMGSEHWKQDWAKSQTKLLLLVHQNIVLDMMKTIATYGPEPRLWADCGLIEALQQASLPSNLIPTFQIWLMQLTFLHRCNSVPSAMKGIIQNYAGYIQQATTSLVYELIMVQNQDFELIVAQLKPCSKHASHQIWQPHPKFYWCILGWVGRVKFFRLTICLKQV